MNGLVWKGAVGEGKLDSGQKLYMCVCILTIAEFARIENTREIKAWSLF